jgi:hypothetical protein
MSESQASPGSADSGREEELSALFAQLVLQQSNLAMMLLGKVPHPESGKTVKDLETARRFIDTLEMLEIKTKGNLGKDESALLKQILMNLRLGFVEAVEEKPAAGAGPQDHGTTGPPDQKTEEEEHRKKFSKKY